MTDFLTKEEGIMRIFRFSSERKQFNTASFAQKQRGKNNCLKTILNLKKITLPNTMSGGYELKSTTNFE